MWEIVERSMTTGGVSKTYSGYATEEAAQADADYYALLDSDYWYEVREQRG